MMTEYITNDDLNRRLGNAAYHQLADDDHDGAADIAIVDAVRRAAQGEVDSYLARRFRTPIDLVAHPDCAALLGAVTLDVAEYRLHARRPPVPDDVRARYRRALEWLADIAAVRAELPAATPLGEAPGTPYRAVVRGTPATLSRESLTDF